MAMTLSRVCYKKVSRQKEFSEDLKEIKEATEELLEYFSEKGIGCSLDEVLEMAEKLLELKRSLKDDV